MSELVDKLKEVGKFESGVNEWRTIINSERLSSKVLAGYDLLFRYAFTLTQLAALYTSNSRSGLETAEILAVGEAAKVGIHYAFKGMDYLQNLVLAYTRKMQSYDRPTTLNLNKP